MCSARTIARTQPPVGPSATFLPTAVAIRDYGTDCELLVARKYTPAVELNWDLLHDKEGTARPCQAQPLQARPLGRLPWEAEIVPT